MHTPDDLQSAFFGQRERSSSRVFAGLAGLALLRAALRQAAAAQQRQDAEVQEVLPPEQRVATLYIGSSALDTARYDPASASLQMGFDSGEVYEFLGVPPAAWEAFRTAGSYGRAFNTQIRSRYTYRRIR